ncbi:hypothetical protein ACI3KS_11190 [Microbacterium sp. ZW T5_45]|uniref:hypothetical protein n=1 Tax=Microbacterium sp. ZW T5_45 TaxID=3378080 RepID=UPI00385555C7
MAVEGCDPRRSTARGTLPGADLAVPFTDGFAAELRFWFSAMPRAAATRRAWRSRGADRLAWAREAGEGRADVEAEVVATASYAALLGVPLPEGRAGAIVAMLVRGVSANLKCGLHASPEQRYPDEDIPPSSHWSERASRHPGHGSRAHGAP